MTYEELMNKVNTEPGYRVLHMSYARGYQKRTIPPTVEPYKGRYGEGWKVHHPIWTSTQYHIVEYIVKED